MISEAEAKATVMQLGTAMLDDDKETRELVYSDLDTDSLKRVIRWSMRMQLNFFIQLCYVYGINPQEGWQKLAMDIYNGDNP